MALPLKILIVDDSALVRQSLARIINHDKSLEVSAVASDTFVAVKKIAACKPDIITLDIEMPKMDGLTFLRKIMSQHPMPVVVISSLTKKGSDLAIKAMEYGAVDVVQKSNLSVDSFQDNERDILEVIKAAGQSRIKRKKVETALPIEPNHVEGLTTTNKIIAVGASTGGTEAIKSFLDQMPIDCPGIVIVQHMPELFTKSFAERLDSILKVQVREAKDGDTILRGLVLIAPGNKHMEVKKNRNPILYKTIGR